jgi:hypothetical protein
MPRWCVLAGFAVQHMTIQVGVELAEFKALTVTTFILLRPVHVVTLGTEHLHQDATIILCHEHILQSGGNY